MCSVRTLKMCGKSQEMRDIHANNEENVGHSAGSGNDPDFAEYHALSSLVYEITLTEECIDYLREHGQWEMIMWQGSTWHWTNPDGVQESGETEEAGCFYVTMNAEEEGDRSVVTIIYPEHTPCLTFTWLDFNEKGKLGEKQSPMEPSTEWFPASMSTTSTI